MRQEKHIRSAYGVDTLLASHPDLRRLKRNEEQPSIHGNKLWGSSYLLMDYFEHHPLPARSRVMELGCGWGTASIYCAKQGASVTAVDADPAVFPYLQLFAQHNGVAIDTLAARFEKLTASQLAEYDVLIAADICFWDELADVVFKLVKRAVRAGVKKVVIADPQRPPFWDMAERCVEQFYGEILDWQVTEPRRFTGSLLVIENE